jgi:tetratricopeptide (TPR) repeat protein
MMRFLWAWLVYTWGGLHRYFGNKNNMRLEHEAAVRYFSRAFEIDPTFRRARMERAVLLWRELGRLDEALVDFDALLLDDPNYSPALLNRAMVYQNQSQFGAALQDLEAYLRLPQSETEVYRQEAGRTADLLRQIVGTRDE